MYIVTTYGICTEYVHATDSSETRASCTKKKRNKKKEKSRRKSGREEKIRVRVLVRRTLERTGDFIIALGRSPLSLVGWHAAPGAGLCVSLICARSEERVYAWTHRSSSLNARPSRRDAARVCSRTRGRVFSDTRCAPFAAHYKLRRRSVWRVRADERARLEMQRGRRARYGIPELARQRHETA